MQEKRNTKKIQLVTVIAVVVLFILILVLVTLVSQKVQMNAKKKRLVEQQDGRSSTDDRKRFGGLRIPSVLGVYRKICERRAGNDRRRRHYMEAGGLIFARNIV